MNFNKNQIQPHAAATADVLKALNSSRHGLALDEVNQRLATYGMNVLPRPRLPGPIIIFFKQFLNPLIYILLVAAVASLAIEKYSDASFIMIVLILNSIIGAIQEYSAQKSAESLHQLINLHAKVIRDQEAYEIETDKLVPGDITLLESGDRVPADLRLLESRNLQIDESLLTGESLPVSKNHEDILKADTPVADRSNMAFTGTLVTTGRAVGVISHTGIHTQLGQIAETLLARRKTKPPLLIRMERFTFRVTVLVLMASLLIGIAAYTQGMGWIQVIMVIAALAVAAIPEGLPVAMTIALSIAMRRMAKRNVIARKLVTVEALGSCTFIATDKTGTLTVNELTVRKLALPAGEELNISGAGLIPEGMFKFNGNRPDKNLQSIIQRIAKASVLANEGFLGRHDGLWTGHGDAVDIAFLVMAHKAGITRQESLHQFPEISSIPYESEQRYAAALNKNNKSTIAHVKGAFEQVVMMCDHMLTMDGEVPINRENIISQAKSMADQGFRVMAVADGEIPLRGKQVFSPEHLKGLCLLGLVGMIDPLRKEAVEAVKKCRDAGISVAMITGDHPNTALAIARDLGMADSLEEVVTGQQINHLLKEYDQTAFDGLVKDAKVFARVEPHHKLQIVQSLQRLGHFVAVTGDGANDAPALRASHVGVAMGKKGTDVARETSDMIITDDNFASIISGIEEGRIAYANVRKVIFLLLSTGVGEIVLFILSLLSGHTIPLTAVQLLWLNLVTNGIQDVALAFEPGEGDELKQKPRSPREPIFNRIMIERVFSSALVIGSISFVMFASLLANGHTVDEARNVVLLLMVLFENIQAFNSRSERRSVFLHNPFQNVFLVISVIAALLLHITAMHLPVLSDILVIKPVSLQEGLFLLLLATSLLWMSEGYKLFRK